MAINVEKGQKLGGIKQNFDEMVNGEMRATQFVNSTDKAKRSLLKPDEL